MNEIQGARVSLAALRFAIMQTRSSDRRITRSMKRSLEHHAPRREVTRRGVVACAVTPACSGTRASASEGDGGGTPFQPIVMMAAVEDGKSALEIARNLLRDIANTESEMLQSPNEFSRILASFRIQSLFSQLAGLVHHLEVRQAQIQKILRDVKER